MSKRSHSHRPERAGRVVVADLLSRPNPWSDWLQNHEIGALGSWRFAALLLRDLEVGRVVDRIGPALLQADARGQRLLDQHLAVEPMPDGVRFGFEHWLNWWNCGGCDPYEAAVRQTMTALGAGPDVDLFAEAIADELTDLTSVLWFLLGAISNWVFEADPTDLVPEARWLLHLLEGAKPRGDPLGVLFAFFYERFRANGGRDAKPLPEELVLPEDSYDLHQDMSSPALPSSDLLLLKGATDGCTEDPSLPEMLADDARSWPHRAGLIAALRTRGLMATTNFTATSLGRFQAGLERDEIRSHDGVAWPSVKGARH